MAERSEAKSAKQSFASIFFVDFLQEASLHDFSFASLSHFSEIKLEN